MDTKKDLIEMVNNLFEIGRMLNALEKQPRTYGSDVLLYSNEAHTLKAIAENQGINQKQLTKLMLRTKGATSVVLDKLLAKGLIEKREDPSDQRAFILFTTPKGAEINQLHREYDCQMGQRWADNAHFTAEEIAITNRVLERSLAYYRKTYL